MKTLEQAARQALEALEDSHQNINPERGFADELQQQIAETIVALREALEQPAQQEPVATVIGKFLTRKDELRTCIEPELPLGTKLYAAPQPEQTVKETLGEKQ